MGKAFLRDPKWQYRNDNPNPRMQPQTNSLIDKVIKMSFLQNAPNRVAYVLQGIAYHYLVKNPNPHELWSLLSNLMFQFNEMVGLKSQTVDAIEAAAKTIESKIQKDSIHHMRIAAESSWPLGHPNHPATINPELLPMYTKPAGSGGVDMMTEVYAAAPVVAEGPVINLYETLANVDIKVGVQVLIDRHIYNYMKNECYCGKEMLSHEVWAKHLRVKIWQYLKNEFPPFGGKGE
jgi:hypothetical protein